MNKIKDMAVRAAWTFAESLLASVLIVGLINVNIAFAKQAVIAAAASALTVIKTFVSQHAGAARNGAEDQLAAEGRTVPPKE